MNQEEAAAEEAGAPALCCACGAAWKHKGVCRGTTRPPRKKPRKTPCKSLVRP